MKALTVLQPWASLIAIEAKTIETRSWYTHYRGPLAIHAGRSKVCLVHGRLPEFRAVLEPVGLQPAELPLGCVIATATLFDCICTEALCYPGGRHRVSRQERAFGDFSPGRWGWLLTDVKPLDKSIPATGAQGLWNWKGGVR